MYTIFFTIGVFVEYLYAYTVPVVVIALLLYSTSVTGVQFGPVLFLLRKLWSLFCIIEESIIKFWLECVYHCLDLLFVFLWYECEYFVRFGVGRHLLDVPSSFFVLKYWKGFSWNWHDAQRKVATLVLVLERAVRASVKPDYVWFPSFDLALWDCLGCLGYIDRVTKTFVNCPWKLEVAPFRGRNSGWLWWFIRVLGYIREDSLMNGSTVGKITVISKWGCYFIGSLCASIDIWVACAVRVIQKRVLESVTVLVVVCGKLLVWSSAHFGYFLLGRACSLFTSGHASCELEYLGYVQIGFSRAEPVQWFFLTDVQASVGETVVWELWHVQQSVFYWPGACGVFQTKGLNICYYILDCGRCRC